MNFAIIVAAGKGKRMKRNSNKVFLPLLGKPMIYHTLKAFHDCSLIDNIIIAARKENIQKMKSIKTEYNFNKIRDIVAGGLERQDSVYNGLMSIKKAKNDDIVVVHNGSSPLVRQNEIADCINAAKKYGAAVAGFPLKDTIKKVRSSFVEKTIDRKDVYQVQTPQAVRYGLFMQAFENAKNKKLKFTDDVSLVEALGKKAKIVNCSYENIKITTQDDLEIAEGILMKKQFNEKNYSASDFFRIGIGQDSHKFASNKGRKLVLGGCTIPNEIGLDADSDGDVVLHALFNAISSAIGERSIGYYSDKMCKDGITDSREYLKVILGKLSQKNYKIGNVSIMVEAQKPRLEKHTDKIKKSLSRILDLDRSDIGIAYTSGEGMTSFGQGKGMQCFVVVTIK